MSKIKLLFLIIILQCTSTVYCHNILLIVQEYGYINNQTADKTESLIHRGERSIALIDYYEKIAGNTIKQIREADCQLLNGQLLFKNKVFSLDGFQGVITRTWNGGLNALHIQKFCEAHGLYADNSTKSTEYTLYKNKMQQVLNKANVNTPHSYIYANEQNFELIDNDLYYLQQKFYNKKLPRYYPAYVMKRQTGTHGKALTFYKIGQEQEIKLLVKDILSNNEVVVIQEYIKAKITAFQVADQQKAATHLRIIMSKINNKYQAIAGLELAKKDSWISNSHSIEGTSIIKPLNVADLPASIITELTKVATIINLNQFGADVIESATDGKYYILELNDGMGLSGHNLEIQQAAQNYVHSFNQRLNLYLIANKK